MKINFVGSLFKMIIIRNVAFKKHWLFHKHIIDYILTLCRSSQVECHASATL